MKVNSHDPVTVEDVANDGRRSRPLRVSEREDVVNDFTTADLRRLHNAVRAVIVDDLTGVLVSDTRDDFVALLAKVDGLQDEPLLTWRVALKQAGKKVRLIYVRAQDKADAAAQVRQRIGRTAGIVDIDRCSEAEYERGTRGR